MLDNKGFDEWAGTYDESISRWETGYPFEGYYKVLANIRKQISPTQSKKVLDIGVGTGLLSYELYRSGAMIWAIDFSDEMIKRARQKMPQATFFLHDIKGGFPWGQSPGKGNGRLLYNCELISIFFWNRQIGQVVQCHQMIGNFNGVQGCFRMRVNKPVQISPGQRHN